MSMMPGCVFGNVVYDPMVHFYLDAWDPFRDVHFRMTPPHASSPFANTRIDWKETPEAHVFTADFPGLKKEEVKVQVEEGRVLSISGEKHIEKEEKTDRWHRVERSSGKFLRRFRLPENAKLEKVTAYIDNGVLTVTVPKEETMKKHHHVRSIEIK